MREFHSIYYFLIAFCLFGLSSCAPKLPPRITMNKIPRDICLGDSIVFEWKSQNANILVFKPFNDTLAPSGILILKPHKDSVYSYRVTAVSGKQKTSKYFSVAVHSPVIRAVLPQQVDDESAFLLKWDAAYSNYVTIEGMDGKFPVKGAVFMMADSTEKVSLTAWNKFGKSCTKTYPLKVKYLEYLSFPYRVIGGETCKVKWKFKKTKEVKLEGWDYPFKPVDSVILRPDKPVHFHVYAIRNNGDTAVELVDFKVVYPRLISFKGPEYIFKGDEAVLIWKSFLIPFVKISGISDSLPPSGKCIVKPDSTTVYTLSCHIKGEVQNLQFTVNVINRELVVGAKKFKEDVKKSRYDFEIFATDFTWYPDSVKLYVLVVDDKGNFITGLAPPYGSEATSRKYFKTLMENSLTDKIYKVNSFRVREQHHIEVKPNDINITLDYSGSMLNTIRDLERACSIFIKEMPENTRLSLVRFSDSISNLCGLISNRDELQKNVPLNPATDTIYLGGTALYAAMDEGLISLYDSARPRQMFVFTDGYECSSFAFFGKRATFAQQVAAKARKNKIRINTVGIGNAINKKVLKFLSSLTGGNYYEIFRPTDIEKVMYENLYLAQNYYEITYKPARIDGERNLTLVYNANNEKTGNATRKVFVGDDFKLEELDSTQDSTYWNRKSSWGKLKALSAPQVVAKFDFAKSELRPKNHKKLYPFLDYLNKNPGSKIVIFGHADKVGDKEACDTLSKKRALSVRKYFTDNGIPVSRTFVEPCGNNHPVWDAEDEPWKAAENRRVELLIVE